MKDEIDYGLFTIAEEFFSVTTGDTSGGSTSSDFTMEKVATAMKKFLESERKRKAKMAAELRCVPDVFLMTTEMYHSFLDYVRTANENVGSSAPVDAVSYRLHGIPIEHYPTIAEFRIRAAELIKEGKSPGLVE